jgi:hypothetical protein
MRTLRPGEPGAGRGSWDTPLRQMPSAAAGDFTDAAATAAIARTTGGNLGLVQRTFAQIQRIMTINNLSTVTREVVDGAGRSLVIGNR